MRQPTRVWEFRMSSITFHGDDQQALHSYINQLGTLIKEVGDLEREHPSQKFTHITLPVQVGMGYLPTSMDPQDWWNLIYHCDVPDGINFEFDDYFLTSDDVDTDTNFEDWRDDMISEQPGRPDHD